MAKKTMKRLLLLFLLAAPLLAFCQQPQVITTNHYIVAQGDKEIDSETLCGEVVFIIDSYEIQYENHALDIKDWEFVSSTNTKIYYLETNSLGIAVIATKQLEDGSVRVELRQQYDDGTLSSLRHLFLYQEYVGPYALFKYELFEGGR